MDEIKTKMVKKNIEVGRLTKVAIFLEGIKVGRGGDIQPLGTYDLEQLWDAIAFLQGDERFECKELNLTNK